MPSVPNSITIKIGGGGDIATTKERENPGNIRGCPSIFDVPQQ